MRKAGHCVALVVALVACTTDEIGEGSGRGGAPASTTAHATTPASYRSYLPENLASILPTQDDAWRRDGGRLTSPGWRAAEQHVFHQLGARLPEHANEPMEVTLGQAERYRLRLTAEDASSVDASEHDGRVVYHRAYASTDAVFVATEDRVEEYLLLADTRAPTSFSYRAALPSHLVSARFEPSGALVFVNGEGDGVLRVPRPFAVDAAGERRDANLRWEPGTASSDGRLSVDLDTRGLSYPILLDPAIESIFWALKSPMNSPGKRTGHAMAYDTARQRTILFGGGTGVIDNANNETWTWDGVDWMKLSPVDSPPPRFGAALAYDSVRQVSVLYGGFCGFGATVTACTDTWEWSGTNWVPKFPLANAGSRTAAAMAYDSVRQRTVIVGASSNTISEWDGVNWVSGASGGALDHPAMAFDVLRQLSVAYSAATTYGWNGITWSTKAGGTPNVRVGAVMAYDSLWNRTVLFGGTVGGTGTYFAETWMWDGTTWTNLTSAGPLARAELGMAYDSVRKRLVLYGGRPGTGTARAFDDTWEGHMRGNACTVDGQCETGHCVDGTCCETASCGSCQSCNLAANPGVCTAVVNAEDANSCSGTKTCDASGVCKNKQGQPCGSEGCLSGLSCADGVCCESLCNLTCQACTAAGKGSGADGVCGYAKTGIDLRSDCPDEGATSCGRDGSCDGAGKCRLYAQGLSCGGGGTTCSGNLVSGQVCDGLGMCKVSSGVDCSPYKCIGTRCANPCGTDTDCTVGNYCDTTSGTGKCTPKLANGSNCASAQQCQSSACVKEGAAQICCNSACNGVCQACTAASKATGADGTCGNARAGTDAHGDCLDDGAPSCQKNGFCDGSGACASYANGIACGTTSCVDNVQTGHSCNGMGTCLSNNTVDCKLYACKAGACATSCSGPSDCAASAYCDLLDATCKAKSPNGSPCTIVDTCASGFCVDGLCCDQACSGQCQACDLDTAKGACSPIVGAPHGPRQKCPVSVGGDVCGARACDGAKDTATCVGYVGADVACLVSSCADGVQTLPATCDGTGQCGFSSSKTKKCEPYVCKGNACGSAPCSTDQDCAPKFRCDQAKHDCVASGASTCKDETTQNNADGSQKPCSPYKCLGSECSQSCSSVDECLAPSVCDATHHCVPSQVSPSGDSGGCGCRTVRRSDGSSASSVLIAAALSLAFAARYRTRSRGVSGRECRRSPNSTSDGSRSAHRDRCCPIRSMRHPQRRRWSR